MESARWKKISALYHQASELEGEARERFLADACKADDDLRHEVEALLEVTVDAVSAIDRAVETVAADYADHLGQIEQIGPYRLVGVIGHGGMGQVFLAERADQEFERQVAIKTISWMRATPLLIERFRHERQILANLDHPNIARMLDGGSSEEDVPYLVMEYIAGQNIIEYCQEKTLSQKQRLDLFLQICDAVQYAHRKLVIHRDIKPSNILVTADGSPKLLDFGIAKLLDADAAVTRADMRFLTQQYASPELVRGEAASTSTDIYGLGLLLYELLTDQFPYPVEGSTSVEIERLILEADPIAPSMAVANSENRVPNLKGDLDNIVLMALRKESDRRYPSVKDLADDVRNFLQHRPVIARTATFRYRTGKFIYRHRLGVVALSTAVLAAIAMTVFYTVQLAAERDVAEQQRRVAESTTQFMVDLFENNSPDRALGEELTARDVLDRGAEKLATELKSSPPVRARLLLTLGRVYERLGLYAPAREYLEQSIELYRNEVPDAEQIMIDNLEELAWIYYRSEDWDKAASAANEALTRREAIVGAHDPSLAKVLNHLGTIAYWRDDFDTTLVHYHRALALLDPNDEELQALRATTLNHLGITYDYLGQKASAEEAYLASYQIRLDLYGENHPDIATAAANLGAYYFNVKDLPRAEEYAKKALDIDRTMHGTEHVNVAFDLGLLASIEEQRDNFAASLEYADEALEMWGRTVGKRHNRYVAALDTIATTYIQMGEFETALQFATRAYDISNAENGEAHTVSADTLYTSGRALRGLDRLDDARDVLLRAADIRLDKLGVNNSAYWDVQQLLSLVEYQAGNLEQAEALIAATFDYVEANLPIDQKRLKIVLDRYIEILKRAGGDGAKLEELILRRSEFF
jgi:serine/threonine-protein kinase